MKYLDKFIVTKCRLEVTGVWEEEKMESHCLMNAEFHFEIMKKFWNWMVVMVPQNCECS